MEIPYPKPSAKIGGRNFWTKGAHREYIAKVTGQSRTSQPDDNDLMTAAQVRKALGGVSTISLRASGRLIQKSENPAPARAQGNSQATICNRTSRLAQRFVTPQGSQGQRHDHLGI
jgi:hypothetical protein